MDDVTQHVYERSSKFYETKISVIHQRGRGIAWRIWPSAHVLIDWLEDNEKKWCRRPVHCIEIGAGVGMVGIAAAAIGASKVTITDLPEAIDAVQRSVDANMPRIRSRISVQPLSYGNQTEIDQVLSSLDRTWKLVILASDIIYWESLFIPIAETLHRFIHQHRATAYIGYRKRDWKTEKRFFTKILAQYKLKCDVVYECQVEEEDGVSQETDGRVVYHEILENEVPQDSSWNSRVYRISKL
jgi:predicted nicotinamide N-methyase